MYQALQTQFSVIGALTIRGMQNASRKMPYGYVWLFLRPILLIGLIRLGQKLTGLEPAGMHGITFLVLGVIAILMFVHTFGLGFKSSGRGLLILPRVTYIDMFVAQGVMTFITYSVLFWLFALPASMFDGVWPPENALGVQFTLILAWMLGMALSAVFTSLTRLFPPIGEFRHILIRTLRVISGMFFVITQFPYWTWPYLTWNPLLHVCELLRSFWFTTYTTPIGSLLYVAAWFGAAGVLGLLLDRYIRRELYT